MQISFIAYKEAKKIMNKKTNIEIFSNGEKEFETIE